MYAVLTTRAVDLNWQMRALRVLPVFVFPGLSYAVYVILGGFTRMRTHNILKKNPNVSVEFLIFFLSLSAYLQNKETD